MERKRKTFEIDIALDHHLKVQSAIENMSINDYVNKTLWASIPQATREVIKADDLPGEA